MKYTPRCFPLAALIAASALFLPTSGYAQQTWTGAGDNVWNAGGGYDGVTGFNDWTGGSGGGVWGGNTFNDTTDNAVFGGSGGATGGTINVDDTGIAGPPTVGAAPFTAPDMEFKSGTWTIQSNTSDPITGAPIDYLVEGAALPSGGFDPTLISVDSGAGPVTISAPIQISDVGPDQQTFVYNSSSSTLTLGSIDFGAYVSGATNDRRLQLSGNSSGGTIVLAGTYTSSSVYGGSINFGNNGTGVYTLASTADFSHFNTGLTNNNAENNAFNFNGDILNIATSKFDGNQTLSFANPSSGDLVNLVGAQQIVLNVYDSMKHGQPQDPFGANITGLATFKQGTADQSSWAGGINLDGSSVGLSAVSGGRLNWNATMGGNAPRGIIVNATADSTGVVVLANGYNYNEADGNGGGVQPSSVLSGDIQHGTALVTNTSGSAFGSSALPVNVEAGATLGGTGIITQQIVAVDKTSVLSAGDAGQSNLGIAASIGTLHLTGGVQATSGLTMDFKLATPGASDSLDLGAGAFTLGGTVTVNLTAFDGTFTGGTFELASGTGTWSDAGATFVFAPPAGYSVTSYSFNANGDGQFDVTLAVPEPSTYALMCLALLVLIGSGKLRKLNAQG